ncbi:MAG: SDR family oxidoreductase [Chitinophagaceae bacterium]|nr:SDR family oxidoreductase [Chitinophagaceae bacterium]
MQKSNPKHPLRPRQKQNKPGEEGKMKPLPVFDYPKSDGSGRLQNKIAFITGGDSGIGKAVAILFAKEGADISIVYLNESKDAEETKNIIEQEYKRKCLLIATDISKERSCINAVKKTVKTYGRIDILVNNAAVHWESKSLEEISTKQLVKTFETNIFSYFWITKAALPSMRKGSTIINTTSVTAYRGSTDLIDYASTKGAIVSFTRSLAHNLIKKGIRVNAVAPGPIWTPLVVSTFDGDKVAKHGSDVPMKRAGEPVEVAPSFLFLACEDASYITGQVLHPNGGEIVNG